ncbi:PspC domain-containing protein [Aeromicrobium sp.]|uniref:PspC domain-containing protein n=1 Tax=Aeromicrobium sp. TaxID=1871063 RepID=UPI003D6B87BC
MTETRQPSETDDGFNPRRLRTIADVRRSKDDRVLAGVCAGAAKYLNVDPVVIRVIIAVLTFVGLAGLILYVAAWLLLPEEGEAQSIVADWFNLDKNEETVRVGGLVVAAVLAVLAIVGDSQWAWWGIPWVLVLVPLAALYWFFMVRSRREHEPTSPADPVGTDTLVLDSAGDPLPEPRKTRGKRSWALTGLTVSVTAIAMAVTLLVAEANGGVRWTTYVAVALGVVALGVLVGTFFGHPGPLVLIGVALTVALLVGWMLPSGASGQRTVTPTTAAAVDEVYEHGMGELVIDLSEVEDADQLLGSTLRVETGWGQTTVIVPDDLNVGLDAEVQAGDIHAFGRQSNGTYAELDHAPDDPGAPALTLLIRHSLGGVDVIEK